MNQLHKNVIDKYMRMIAKELDLNKLYPLIKSEIKSQAKDKTGFFTFDLDNGPTSTNTRFLIMLKTCDDSMFKIFYDALISTDQLFIANLLKPHL